MSENEKPSIKPKPAWLAAWGRFGELAEAIYRESMYSPNSIEYVKKLIEEIKMQCNIIEKFSSQSPSTKESMKEIVWIVSWYNYGEPPIVTPFNNKEAAQKYYEYELGNDHEKVDIDECEVYSTFTIS